MPFLGRIAREDLSNVYNVPQLAVRVIEDDDVVSGRSTGLVGEIREDFVPLMLTQAPGPVGGGLTLRYRDYLWLKGDRPADDVEWWGNKTITLEMRENVNNRALQRVLFRGKVATVDVEYDGDSLANGVTLHCRDFWMQFADGPVAMRTEGMTLGGILTAFVNGFYYRTKVVDGVALPDKEYFPQKLLPETDDGVPLAEIDPELLASNRRVATVSISGQTFAEAFAELIEAAFGGSRIPDIEYDDRGVVRLVARERGAVERDLVVGSPGTDHTERRMCEVKSIRGSIDYSQVRNRVYGVGAPVRVIKPVELTKGWTDAEEVAVAANPLLIYTRAYKHVFRRYKAPEAFWNAIGHAWGGGVGGQHDAMVFWQFAEVLDEGITSTPLPVSPNFEIHRERTSGDTEGVVIDDLREIRASDARHLSIYFYEGQYFKYRTEAQKALQRLGQDPGAENIAPYRYEMEAVIVDDPVTVDTGIIGDGEVPRVRTAYVENRNIIKHRYEKHYGQTADGTRVEYAEPEWTLRDDTPYFQGQLTELAQTMSQGKQDVSVTWWRFEPEFRLGDRQVRIVSNANRALMTNLNWYVDSLQHDLQMYRTMGQLSRNLRSYVGAAYL